MTSVCVALITFFREEEVAKGLEYEVGTIGADIVMLQEDIKMVQRE